MRGDHTGVSEAHRESHHRLVWGSAVAFFGLLVLAGLLFSVGGWLAAADEGVRSPLAWLRALDGPTATGHVASAAEVVAGVLAVAITVVAIVVELAATRYTHRITQLFVREPINGLVLGFFVLTTILCVWVSTTPGTTSPAEALLPHAGLVLCMAMVTVCLLLIIPYFAFVFDFVAPVHVIARIRRHADRSVRGARGGRARRARRNVIGAVDELQDVAHGARQHSDRSISMAAVDALAGVLRDYQPRRTELPESWFRVDGDLARDPDFVSMDRVAMAGVVEDKTWLETKILRQYLAIFTESLGNARDISNLVALDTRQVGIEAVREHPALSELCIRFFNSYLRAAINAGDQRSAYYVLQQYRILCEGLLAGGRGDLALEVAGHFRFYGQLGYTQGLPFLLEVVAYDLTLVVEYAVEAGHPEADPLLTLFLEVDRESETPEQEERLREVRRAQVQLATFFLERGEEVPARRIFADMEHERPERIAAVREKLRSEVHAQYWEFTDRGINFGYLPPDRRAHLDEFFSWFAAR